MRKQSPENEFSQYLTKKSNKKATYNEIKNEKLDDLIKELGYQKPPDKKIDVIG